MATAARAVGLAASTAMASTRTGHCGKDSEEGGRSRPQAQNTTPSCSCPAACGIEVALSEGFIPAHTKCVSNRH